MAVRVYKYGAFAPSLEKDVEERLFQGNRYRNSLIEIELYKRQQTDRILQKHVPGFVELKSMLESVDQQICDEESKVKRLNQAEGRRKRRVGLRLLRKERSRLSKQIREQSKQLRKIEYGSAVRSVQAAYDKLTDGPNSSRRKELKKKLSKAKLECCTGYQRDMLRLKLDCEESIKQLYTESSLFWCHKNSIKDDVDKACKKTPRFRRYNGTGRLYTQIQGGISCSDVFTSNDWFYLDSNSDRCVAYVRIATNNGRPVMTEVPIVLHRDLPDGVIKGVSIVRKRCATKVKWELQVYCDSDYFPTDACESEASVGIDLGWRYVSGFGWDGLKVAHVVGSDGEEEELIVPRRQLDRWSQIDRIKSSRDNCYNAVLDVFTSWIKQHRVPEWLLEKTKHIRQWRSQNRLAGLIYLWRSNRFPGDEAIFSLLDGRKIDYLKRKTYRRRWAGWRNWDKHLYEWQENLRRKAIDWRLDYYRKFAARLSRKYGLLKMENADWSKTIKRSVVEEESNDDIKKNQRIAAPGLLRQVLETRFTSWVRVESFGTTARCHVCGEWCDVGAGDTGYCLCGASWNRDYNAAYNILASQEIQRQASSGVVVKTP